MSQFFCHRDHDREDEGLSWLFEEFLFTSRFDLILHIPCISIPKTCKHKVNFADFTLIYSYDLVVPAYIAIFSWIPALTVRHSDSPLSGTQVQVAQLTNTKIKTSRLSKAISYGWSNLNDSNGRLPWNFRSDLGIEKLTLSHIHRNPFSRFFEILSLWLTFGFFPNNLSWLFVQPPSELHKLGLSRSEKECRNYRKKQNKQQHIASRIIEMLKMYGSKNIEFDIALQFLSTTFTPQGPLYCWTRFYFFLVIDHIFGSTTNLG